MERGKYETRGRLSGGGVWRGSVFYASTKKQRHTLIFSIFSLSDYPFTLTDRDGRVLDKDLSDPSLAENVFVVGARGRHGSHARHLVHINPRKNVSRYVQQDKSFEAPHRKQTEKQKYVRYAAMGAIDLH